MQGGFLECYLKKKKERKTKVVGRMSQSPFDVFQLHKCELLHLQQTLKCMQEKEKKALHRAYISSGLIKTLDGKCGESI